MTEPADIAPADAGGPLPLGDEISISTAAYGNLKSTRLCIDSLLASATGNFELILIDDCSPDSGEMQALFRAVRQRHANTRIFSFTENLEYSGSVNAALSHAGGQWVFFISNDVFVTPSYLRALLKVGRANPQLGILRGSSNFVDNDLPSHNLVLPRPITTMHELFKVGAEIAGREGETWTADPFLVGDAFLVARPVLERIGTFDPRFYGYFADLDFGLRAQIAGFQPALVRGAFAYHQRAANFEYLPEKARAVKLERRWMRVIENWARFKMKYGMPVSLPYESITLVPWQQLASRSFEPGRDYNAPEDYSRYSL